MASAIRDMTTDELRQFAEIIARLERVDFGFDVRGDVLPSITRLLRADFAGSYVWNAREKRFTQPRAYNLPGESMRRYDDYFRFRDPISQRVRGRRRACYVEEVIARSDLEKTEFYNDFLTDNGLYHGLDMYVFDGDEDLGDLRIWRSRRQQPFEQRDKDVLSTIEPFLRRALIRARGICSRLTMRERDVVALVAKGVTDRSIAEILGISFATVRTHLSKAMDKSGCANRAELAAHVSKQAG